MPNNQAIAYNELFEFFLQEHGLTLIYSEIDDIIKALEKFKETFNK